MQFGLFLQKSTFENHVQEKHLRDEEKCEKKKYLNYAILTKQHLNYKH